MVRNGYIGTGVFGMSVGVAAMWDLAFRSLRSLIRNAPWPPLMSQATPKVSQGPLGLAVFE